jgi:uncharacterized protein YhjY with autotransporter beta-barrel domain
VFWATYNYGGASRDPQLISVTTSGIVTEIGSPVPAASWGPWPSLTIDKATGQLYSWNEGGDRLSQWDKATGLPSNLPIDSTIDSYSYSLDFAPDGKLYFINGDGDYYSVNYNDGSTVSLGSIAKPVSSRGAPFALGSFDSDGNFWSMEARNWDTIYKFDSNGTFLSSIDITSGNKVRTLRWGPSGITPGNPALISNPYSTTFSGGTLIVDIPGTYSSNFTLGNLGGTIDINGKTSELSGIFSGNGAIAFENLSSGGSINLTGQNTYMGSTTIKDGATVYVNGSLASSSNLVVESGGVLGGAGLLPATTVQSGGKIAPGNSIGTINVASLDLSGGTIEAEIQGPQSDLVSVAGNVTNFTGTAKIKAYGGGGPWPSFTYTIVDASTSPDFATSSSLNLDQSEISSALLASGTNLIQAANSNSKTFNIQWQPKNGSGAVSSAMKSLSQGANQIATAAPLDKAFNTLSQTASNNANNTGSPIGTTGFTSGQASASGLSPAFLTGLSELLSLTSNSQLVSAITSLSPESYAAFQSVGLETLKRQREQLLTQAGNCSETGWVVNKTKSSKAAKPRNPLCIFGLASNATSSINGNQELASYNSGIFSSFYGAEYQLSRSWTVGAAYGYGTSYLNNMQGINASVSSGVNSGSLYGVYKPSNEWTIRGIFGYSNFNTSGSRTLNYIGDGSSINGNPIGNGYTTALNADYLIKIKGSSSKNIAYVKPMLGIAWGGYQQGAFNETGSSAFNLNVQGNTANSLVGTVGFELASFPIHLNKSKTTSLIPKLAIAYQGDAFGNYSNVKSLTSSFQSAPSTGSFVTEGQNRGVNSVILDGGIDLALTQNASIYASAGYESFSNGSQFMYGGGLKVRF